MAQSETIKAVAQEAYATLHRSRREAGCSVEITCDAPQGSWIRDMIRKAHGAMLPDDWIYEFVHDALLLIIQNDGDTDRAQSEIEADIYDNRLIAWLSSNSDRQAYADTAITDFGAKTIISACIYGQADERDEVFSSVALSLTKEADQRENEDQ